MVRSFETAPPGPRPGCKPVRAGWARRDGERLLLRLFAFLGFEVAILDHAIEHVIAPLDRALALPERMIIVRSLGERRQISSLGRGELMHRLVEVKERRGRNTVGAEPEINFVEIELEDLVLRVGALDLQRQQRFLDLALE